MILIFAQGFSYKSSDVGFLIQAKCTGRLCSKSIQIGLVFTFLNPCWNVSDFDIKVFLLVLFIHYLLRSQILRIFLVGALQQHQRCVPVFAIPCCLLSLKGAPEIFTSLFQSLNANNQYQVRAYSDLSPEITTSSSFRQDFLFSSSVFSFAIVMVKEITLTSCENNAGDICSNRNLYNLEYAEDVVLLSKDPI